jgi:hypothetical protein
MLTYADLTTSFQKAIVCPKVIHIIPTTCMLTYAHVCSQMLYIQVIHIIPTTCMLTYAHVCSRMLCIQVIHIIPTSVPVLLLQGEEVRG